MSDALFREADRQLGKLTSTRYQHMTYVDECTGVYQYDCSGFLDYALERIAPEALAELPRSHGGRPLAIDFVHLFKSLDERRGFHWHPVEFADQLTRGCVIAWSKPKHIHGDNTGHVMIVAQAPHQSGTDEREIIVRVIDSTEFPFGATQE